MLGDCFFRRVFIDSGPLFIRMISETAIDDVLSYAIGQAACFVEVVGGILAALNALYHGSFMGGTDGERRDDGRVWRWGNHLGLSKLINNIIMCIVRCRRSRFAVFL